MLTPRAARYGYETRCASVVKVSDYAVRRVKPLSLPIVLGSTFQLDDCAHGARLHEKREAPCPAAGDPAAGELGLQSSVFRGQSGDLDRSGASGRKPTI